VLLNAQAVEEINYLFLLRLLLNDLPYIIPGSRLTCFTSLVSVRPNGLVYVRDPDQKNGILFLLVSACHHSLRELYT
jgi:hypothetical protein